QRSIRKITADQCPLDAPSNCLADDQDFFHRDFQGTGMAPQVDPHGVAYRDDIYAGAIDDLRNLIVPCHYPDDFLSVALHLLKRRDGDGGILSLHGCLCLVIDGWVIKFHVLRSGPHACTAIDVSCREREKTVLPP